MEKFAIIIKLKGKKAYVVNEGGIFEAIKFRDGMFEGQKIFYDKEDRIENNFFKMRYVSAALAGLAALFIFAYLFFELFFIEKTYAYIHIDINPSIELLIDKNGKVLNALPINEDAGNLLENSKYKGLPLNSAILNLLYKSPDYGFTGKKSRGNFILISAAMNDKVKHKNKEYDDTFLDDMFDDLKDKVRVSQIDVTMQLMRFPSEYLEYARKSDVSMGRFYVYKRLQEKGCNITIEEIKKVRLLDIMMENGIEPFNSTENSALNEPAAEPRNKDSLTGATLPPTQTPMPSPTKTSAKSSQSTAASERKNVHENKDGGNKQQKTQEKTQQESVDKNLADSSTIAVSGNANKDTGIKVQLYNYNAVNKSNIVFIRMKVINTGSKSVILKDVKLRYYYTMEGDKEQMFVIDWSTTGAENMTGNFVKMDSSKDKADTYLEIGFTDGAGRLEPGKSVEMTGRFNKEDWSVYDQTNDYSFTTVQKYKDNKKVTGYISGNLVWGVEP